MENTSKHPKRLGVTRRTFMRGMALTAASAAGAAALSGCSNQVAQGTETSGSKSVAWDESFDTVVIGAGAAGFAAALSAAENNADASILILEKSAMIGGNSAVSGGNYGAPGTPLQIKQGESDEAFENDSPDLYYEEKRKLGEYRSDPKLTRVFADKALEGYEWLTSLGVEFGKVGTYEKPITLPENPQGMYLHSIYNMQFSDGQWIGAMTKGRHHKESVYKGQSGGGANIAAMKDAADAFGNITVRTKSEVTEILREGVLTGDVLGVVAEGKNIEAKRGVVLASGGFSANAEMCSKYDSRLSVEGRNTGVESVTGDSLISAIDIGADTMNMDFVQIRMARSGISYSCDLLLEKQGTYIDIDPNGERFWKEVPDSQAYRSARLTELYERGFINWWSVSDSSAIEANKVKDEALQQAFGEGSIVQCDSVEELAKTIDVPVNTLQATLDRFNGFVDSGIDEDFGLESKHLKWKVATPPYYAVPRTYYRQHTCGGVCTNENAQVVDRRGKTIPRFYAAGEAMGGVHGTERNGGCGWTECIVFGRLAGKALAETDPRE